MKNGPVECLAQELFGVTGERTETGVVPARLTFGKSVTVRLWKDGEMWRWELVATDVEARAQP